MKKPSGSGCGNILIEFVSIVAIKGVVRSWGVGACDNPIIHNDKKLLKLLSYSSENAPSNFGILTKYATSTGLFPDI